MEPSISLGGSREGLDVYRMIRSDIEIINEREKELFSSFTD
jgi:hypothetical protein